MKQKKRINRMSVNWRKPDEDEVKKKSKNMKLSSHCNITNPETAGYPYLESIRSFANLCDEVIVVDGGSKDGSLKKISKIPKVKIIQGEKWNRDFDWTIMAKNLQMGYENCQYDWAFHFDVDYIFHEKLIDKLKERLSVAFLPAMELKKINFVLADENFEKGHFPLLLNKKYQALCYGLGGDRKDNVSATFLRPTARKGPKGKDGLYRGDAVDMSLARLHREDIDVYTYDFTFMTKEQVAEQRHRFENSVRRFRRLSPLKKDIVFKGFVDMMRHRHSECRKIKLEEHSKFIRERVKNIKPEMFGHSMWGMYLDDAGVSRKNI